MEHHRPPKLTMKCPHCGRSIRLEGNFCKWCGKNIEQERSNTQAAYGWVFIGGFIGLFIGGPIGWIIGVLVTSVIVAIIVEIAKEQ